MFICECFENNSRKNGKYGACPKTEVSEQPLYGHSSAVMLFSLIVTARQFQSVRFGTSLIIKVISAMKKKIALLTAPRSFEIAEEEIPLLDDYEVLVRIVSSGLCHSDVPSYLGEGAYGEDSLGNACMVPVSYPLRFGHEAQGVAEDVGKKVTRLKPGDFVAGVLKPGYASYAIAPEKHLVNIPLKPKDPLLCIAEPLMCIVNIVRTACPEFGDTDAVVGCGSMGLLTIAGLTKSGARNIVAVDVQENRLALARQWGATHAINSQKEDVLKILSDLSGGKGADVVVEISGTLRGLDTAVSLLREASLVEAEGRAKLLIPSLYARDEKWQAETGYALMFKSPVIHTTHPRYAIDLFENYRRAIQAYEDDILPIDRLITHRYRLENIGEGFEQLINNKTSFLKGIIDFSL
jgi:threonine dehydrogenase-like Zn-dependent dehydrogenase